MRAPFPRGEGVEGYKEDGASATAAFSLLLPIEPGTAGHNVPSLQVFFGLAGHNVPSLFADNASDGALFS